MDSFDFEELVAEILGISDDQRENDDYLPDKFFDKFEIDLDQGFNLAGHLIMHTIPVEAGISGKSYHAFVSRENPFMLMKVETTGSL